ncbi:unnamed protein product [Zymoseptoria tritici ST99CH_1A5]|uniref:Uncharacterized protein n=2 Tax=Zymoseptoria tritici TaxID=1047171 RepID=A0A2H1H7S0_ZYMTR|nr:unnamed protein product [Zymoseptoria tritici ST99CH_1E4]SMR64323.1 unnamed protein product [Zymoseptoria tritici ST99CH_3D1]SMY29667.1 unnamed protein product [Zymoseptoria tritici ST99CH_1A5]
MDSEPAAKRRRHNATNPAHKRAPLPTNAHISKRPLLHPVLSSPYSATSPKVVYVASRTPFLSAVARCEKLLRQADKRLVQSATTKAKNETWRRGRGGGDEIAAIAGQVESIKRKRRRGGGVGLDEAEDGAGSEEVVIKGTGKAIQKVLELGCWFQQRGEVYDVKIRTGTAKAVDGIEYNEPEAEGEELDKMGLEDGNGEDLPEARIRHISVLEVCVSLR